MCKHIPVQNHNYFYPNLEHSVHLQAKAAAEDSTQRNENGSVNLNEADRDIHNAIDEEPPKGAEPGVDDVRRP